MTESRPRPNATRRLSRREAVRLVDVPLHLIADLPLVRCVGDVPGRLSGGRKPMKTRIMLALVACLLLALPASPATVTYLYDAQHPPLVTLLSAATTGNGDEVNLHRVNRETTVNIKWSAGCGAGVITVEVAETCGYAGTWAPWSVVAWSAASKTDVVHILAPVGCVRSRVSTTVTGGTVTSTLSAVR